MDTTNDLFAAVKSGDAATVRALLAESPGLVNARDEGGLTPLMTAVYRDMDDIVALLRDAGAEEDIFAAAALGNAKRVAALLSEQPELLHSRSADGWTPLHLAAYFGHVDTVEALIATGAEVNAAASNSMAGTPLHAAASNGHSDVAAALLTGGADANARQSGGWTALHSAAENGDTAMATLLINHGADSKIENDAGLTPLSMAEAAKKNDVAEVLRNT